MANKYKCPVCGIVIEHDGEFPDFVKTLLWECPSAECGGINRNFALVSGGVE